MRVFTSKLGVYIFWIHLLLKFSFDFRIIFKVRLPNELLPELREVLSYHKVQTILWPYLNICKTYVFEATSSSILLIETESSETSDSDFDRARLIVRNISGRLKIIAFNNGMQLLNISVDEW